MNPLTNWQKDKFSGLFLEAEYLRTEDHQSGDIHYIGEALPAPSIVLPNALVSSVGDSPIPARENHVHGLTMNDQLIFSSLAERNAYTGPKQKGTFCYVSDVDARYQWYQGTSNNFWRLWDYPTGNLSGGFELSWAPAWTGLTVGNGSVTARFQIKSSRVYWKMRLVFGSTTSIGASPRFTVPYTFIEATETASIGVYNDGDFIETLTSIIYFDATGGRYFGLGYVITANTIGFLVNNSASANAVAELLTSTIPFPWTTNDIIIASGHYGILRS